MLKQLVVHAIVSILCHTSPAPVRRVPNTNSQAVENTFIILFNDQPPSDIDTHSSVTTFNQLLYKHVNQLREPSEAIVDIATLESLDNSDNLEEDFEITTGDSSFRPLRRLNGYIARLESHQSEKLQWIAQQPETQSIERDQVVVLDFTNDGRHTKTDGYFAEDACSPTEYLTQKKIYSWGIDRIDENTNSQFRYPKSAGEGVTIYVLDTGVRQSHLDFRTSTGTRALKGVSFVSGEDGSDDKQGHGTHVAGTAAGAYSGVAKKALVQPVKVLSASGSGTYSGIIKGIEYAVADSDGTKKAVINMSLGGGKSNSLNTVVNKAVDAGVVVVVAAGNSAADACNASPASASQAITVGATDSNDNQASFSNYGSCVDIQSPGVSIVSSSNSADNRLRSLSGTSMASPHVAGIAAVYLSEGATAKDIPKILQDKAQRGAIKRVRSGTTDAFSILK